MIKESDIYKIGILTKTHGLKGEISFVYDTDVFDTANCSYLILNIDGIFVPFFIKEYRFRNDDTALIIFDDYESQEKANELNNLDVYLPIKYMETSNNEIDEDSWDVFLNFTVEDIEGNKIGTITQIDDSTMNTLFVVKEGEKEQLIPADENFIKGVDLDNKTIVIQLIEGLLDLN